MKHANHPSNPNFSPKPEAGPLLNEDQVEFLEQISNGVSTAHAGELRGWTDDTARNYQSALLRPLDARTASHAVRRGFELELLRPNETAEPPVRVLVTQEEKDVLLFASLGYVTPQIAQMQNRSPKMIYRDRRHIYGKYGADNMPHAIRIAIERGDIRINDPTQIQAD